MQYLKYRSLGICSIFLIAISWMSSLATAQEELADVIERCEKSVVRIEVEGKEGESLGSGFVVNESGMIVTNVHVLAGAIKAKAIFADKTSATITGTLHFDKTRDICVARLSTGNYKPIKVHQSLPRKGETVTALGAPRGLSFTATNGIVSALREGKSIDPEYNGQWVQIDAALSPGNSGGPIINRSGEVVAMSTLASRGDSQNLNFGISSTDITEAIRKASNKKKVVSLAQGIGKVVYESSGSGAPGKIIQNNKVPKEDLASYIKESRNDYAKLSKRFRDRVTDLQRKFSQMKRGRTAIPGQTRGDVAVAVDAKGKEIYFFRSDRVKERELGKTEHQLTSLREAKKLIGKELSDEALLALLQHTGGFFDPREENSIGFMSSAICLHSINENEAIVLFDEQPYLMWLPKTTGLSGGTEIAPMSVYVSGTQTITAPGRGTQSLTVLVAVSEDQIREAIGVKANDSSATFADQEIRKWTSGKFTVMATLVAIQGDDVTIRTEAGKEIVVPRGKLSSSDHDYLKALQ